MCRSHIKDLWNEFASVKFHILKFFVSILFFQHFPRAFDTRHTLLLLQEKNQTFQNMISLECTYFFPGHLASQIWTIANILKSEFRKTRFFWFVIKNRCLQRNTVVGSKLEYLNTFVSFPLRVFAASGLLINKFKNKQLSSNQLSLEDSRKNWTLLNRNFWRTRPWHNTPSNCWSNAKIFDQKQATDLDN